MPADRPTLTALYGNAMSAQIFSKSSDSQLGSCITITMPSRTGPWQEQGFCYYLLVCLARFCLSILLCNVFTQTNKTRGKLKILSQSDKTDHGNLVFSFPSFYQSWYVFAREEIRPTANVWQWPRLFSHQKPSAITERERESWSLSDWRWPVCSLSIQNINQ